MYVITNKKYPAKAAKYYRFDKIYTRKETADKHLEDALWLIDDTEKKCGKDFEKEIAEVVRGCEVLPFKGFIL